MREGEVKNIVIPPQKPYGPRLDGNHSLADCELTFALRLGRLDQGNTQ